jgi:hypothetical protein
MGGYSLLLALALSLLLSNCRKIEPEPQKKLQVPEANLQKAKDWFEQQKYNPPQVPNTAQRQHSDSLYFVPQWQSAKYYPGTHQSLIIVPIWRPAVVSYNPQISFVRRLVLKVNQAQEIEEGILIELVAAPEIDFSDPDQPVADTYKKANPLVYMAEWKLWDRQQASMNNIISGNRDQAPQPPCYNSTSVQGCMMFIRDCHNNLVSASGISNCNPAQPGSSSNFPRDQSIYMEEVPPTNPLELGGGNNGTWDLGESPAEPLEPPLSPADSAKLARLNRICKFGKGFDQSTKKGKKRALELARTIDDITNSHPAYARLFEVLTDELSDSSQKLIIAIDNNIESNATTDESGIVFKNSSALSTKHTVAEEFIHVLQLKVIYRDLNLTKSDYANLELEAKLIIDFIEEDNKKKGKKRKERFNAAGVFEHLSNPNLPPDFPKPRKNIGKAYKDYIKAVVEKEGLPKSFGTGSFVSIDFALIIHLALLQSFIDYSAYQSLYNSFNPLLPPKAMFFLFQNL